MKSAPSLIFLAVVGTVFSMIPAHRKKAPDTPKITYINHGRIVVLDPASAKTQAILRTAEDSLVSAESMFKLIVTSDDIHGIKAHEQSLEIVYPKPRLFKVAKFTNPVTLDHLLIPLTGDYAASGGTKFITIFHGVGQYGPGPYTNTGVYHDKLRNLLKDLGQPVD